MDWYQKHDRPTPQFNLATYTMPTVYVPRAFVYVLGGMLSTIWVVTYQDLLVMRYRKSAGIEQPKSKSRYSQPYPDTDF